MYNIRIIRVNIAAKRTANVLKHFFFTDTFSFFPYIRHLIRLVTKCYELLRL